MGIDLVGEAHLLGLDHAALTQEPVERRGENSGSAPLASREPDYFQMSVLDKPINGALRAIEHLGDLANAKT